MKEGLKQKAIALRKEGLSYSEILLQVPVAKSTLGLWLHSVELAKHQKQRLTEKKLLSAMRGGEARREQRIFKTRQIYEQAHRELGKISKRELWLIGVALHWAEGSKEKEGRPGIGVMFTNSDHRMIYFFLMWLQVICNVPKDQIYFDIYIHDTKRTEMDEIRNFLATVTGYPPSSFQHIYFKKSKIKTNRTNTGNLYHGVVKIRVRTSSSLNRKIDGLIDGITKHDWGMV
ncbi:MAG: hypothetical protein A2946_02960 [Candidatus Liptonbacteria bacterium RIFCSPLOWO2_01_FULL_53_13]|uniref:Uncharacterized protein n=1 Tax=Candidatus Liptonbacteria bacterium RIFCSPLOWO2_01_FULL_53_13 TaxID=1798651 RepID=A0A1G2CKI8_9BACT|nr:MAG: hypothetical protein A2946_02960 [Candidatus Liptonbacteria bacterium RIFCSPLOWO2_01_FULL_53_13]